MTGPAQGSSDDRVMMLEHAEIVIKEAPRLGIRTRIQAIAFVGRNFRGQLGIHESKTDLEVSCAERCMPWGLQLARASYRVHSSGETGI